MERKEAKALGLKRYSTGRPCSRGHTDERSTATSRCTQCVREEMHERRHVHGYRAQDSQYERTRMQGETRERYRLRERERRKSDPEYRERINKYNREQQRRRYQEDPLWRAKVRVRTAQRRATPEGKAKRKAEYEQWYRNHPDVQRVRMRQLRYGVNAAQWQTQLEAQGFKCGNPACDAEVNDSSALDHCHTTGKVRGILCSRCNYIEGVIDKHMDKLIGLIAYRDSGGVWAVNKELSA